MENLEQRKTVEFEQKYVEQVKTLIYKILKELGADERETLGHHIDADLNNIPEVYKGRSRFWITLEQDRVIGTIAVQEISEDVAKLKRMFIAEEFHGTGVAQKLLETALSFTKGNGYKKITLNTSKLMKRAHRFYEKNGFKRVSEGDVRFSYELSLN